MNTAKKAGLAVGSLTAALMLAGCNSNITASASGQSSTPAGSATTAAGSAATGAPAGAPGTTAPAASGTGAPGTGGSGSSASGSGTSGTGHACTASELALQQGVGSGPETANNGYSTANWNLTNSVLCTMDGYPGVDLVGINEDTGLQMRLSVPRATGATPSLVNLNGGMVDGQLSISYLQGVNSSFEFKVTQMIITPPGTYNQITYPVSGSWMIAEDNNPVKIHANVEPISYGGHN